MNKGLIKKRLQSELKLVKKKYSFLDVNLVDDDIFKWLVVMDGPTENSHYIDGKYTFKLVFGENYPQHPPLIKLITDIYHINIEGKNICISLLNSDWKSTYKVPTIMTAIRSFLDTPNPDSALNNNARSLYNNETDHRTYYSKVRSWVYIYATPHLEELLRKELDYINSECNNLEVTLTDNNIFKWDIIMDGPEKGPYSEGRFKFKINFNTGYPSERRIPSITAVTNIFHINFSENREISDSKDDYWKYNYKVSEIMNHIKELLDHPCVNYVKNSFALEMYNSNFSKYNDQVIKMVREHALPKNNNQNTLDS